MLFNAITFKFVISVLNRGTTEDSLRVWEYDSDKETWISSPGHVDVIENVVTGKLSGFGYFTISGEKSPVLQDIISLSKGWNFITSSKRLAHGYNTANIFSEVQTRGHSMLTYNPVEEWVVVKKDDIIDPLVGYWIYSDTECLIPLHIDSNPVQVPPIKKLYEGWNSIGFSSSISASARDALLSVQNSWVYCIGYDAKMQKFDVPIINEGTGGFSDSRMLSPNHGYWDLCHMKETWQVFSIKNKISMS